jgi:hypothetical protein
MNNLLQFPVRNQVYVDAVWMLYKLLTWIVSHALGNPKEKDSMR